MNATSSTDLRPQQVLCTRTLLLTAILLFCPCPSTSFTFTPTTRTNRNARNGLTSATLLRGVLSRNAIVSSCSNGGQKKDESHHRLSKSFLVEVLDEASYRQTLALESLDRELENKVRNLPDNDSSNHNKDHDSERQNSSTAPDSTSVRKLEILTTIEKLQALRVETKRLKNPSQIECEHTKTRLVDMGFESIFRRPTSSWKSKRAQAREFGRPDGFDGPIYYSPLGVPILIGRTKAHKDDIMRSAAQGSDLWFQVEDYEGSRVLLRTSLVRGTKGSKRCRQAAADLAARYSVLGEEGRESVPVMYTDTRKVAKRGSKVGQMKQKKSLGRMMGRPRDVEDIL